MIAQLLKTLKKVKDFEVWSRDGHACKVYTRNNCLVIVSCYVEGGVLNKKLDPCFMSSGLECSFTYQGLPATFCINDAKEPKIYIRYGEQDIAIKQIIELKSQE